MDAGSSTYVATFDGKDALAELVEAEYLRRGGEHFRQVVAIGDGAAWIWTMAEKLYPHATHIVDIYHAREHLHDLAAHLAFITPDPAQWLARPQRRAGRREHQRHHQRRPLATRSTASRPATWTRSWATSSATRTGCATQHFRDLGMFTGSGAIEGGINAIVVQRAKQSGMHWTVDGAADILALRCQHASGRWDDSGRAPRSRPGPGTPRRRLTDTATQNRRSSRPGQDHLQQS